MGPGVLGTRLRVWGSLRPLPIMGSGQAPRLREEGLRGCEGRPCRLGTGHRHLCLAGLCRPSAHITIACVFQVAIAMVTLKMVLFQAGYSALTNAENGISEMGAGLCARGPHGDAAAGRRSAWDPVPPGRHVPGWGAGGGGSLQDGKRSGKGNSRKVAFSGSAPGVDGAGTSRALPGDGMCKTSRPRGPVGGMGQAFGGAASSPQRPEPTSTVLVFHSYHWILHPCKEHPFLFVRPAHRRTARLDFFPSVPL